MQFKYWLQEHANEIIGYHATDQKFDQFTYSPGKRFVLWTAFDVTSHGFFFWEDIQNAYDMERVYIAEVRLSFKHPFLDPRIDLHLGVESLDAKREEDLKKIMMPMIEGEPGRETIDIGIQKYGIDFDNPYWAHIGIDRNGIQWDVLDNPKCVAVMKSLGYDGTFVDEGEKRRSIFVIDPNQIQIIRFLPGRNQRNSGR